MKKSMMAAQLAIAFVCVQGGAALAAPGAWGDGPGCGLGQLVFASQPKTIMHQVLARQRTALGIKHFGISTGTSNCTNNGADCKK